MVTFIAGLFWSLIFAIVLPGILIIWIGYGVSRLAQRLAACQNATEYPTAEILESTFQEAPEQWPPLPTIGRNGASDEK